MNVYCVLSLLCTRLYQLSCKKNLVVFCPHFFSLLLAHKILEINLEKKMLILEIIIGKSNNIELFWLNCFCGAYLLVTCQVESFVTAWWRAWYKPNWQNGLQNWVEILTKGAIPSWCFVNINFSGPNNRVLPPCLFRTTLLFRPIEYLPFKRCFLYFLTTVSRSRRKI